MHSLEEKRLIRKAKQQNAEAFTSLMQMHTKDLYRIGMAILKNDQDVADAIQDTILSCWEKMKSLKSDKYFKTWLTRIMINKCYDIQKRSVSYVEINQIEEIHEKEQQNTELKNAIEILDEKYRVPIVLYYSFGYKTNEIAQIMDIPISTVQTRLQRGRKKLLSYLKES